MDSFKKTVPKFHPLQNLDPIFLNHISLVNRENIKLLTYNFFLRPPPIKTNESDHKDGRLNDFMSNFDQFDIICFQEMFGAFSGRKDFLLKRARKSGFFFSTSSPSPDLFSKYVIDGGLMILSRFPIIKKEFLPFAYGIQSDSLSQKGVLYAKVEVKDTILHVFTCHFQASYLDNDSKLWNLAIETRKNQMKQLSNYIKNCVKSNKNTDSDLVILCGDFNVDYHQFEEMKKRGFKVFLENESNEYQTLVDYLGSIGEPIDIFKEVHVQNPFTFGVNGDEHPQYDKVLTGKEDFGSFQTLDYMFEIKIDQDSKNEKSNNKLEIVRESALVEPFLIENKPYQQLSDHLGLSIEIKYFKN